MGKLCRNAVGPARRIARDSLALRDILTRIAVRVFMIFLSTYPGRGPPLAQNNAKDGAFDRSAYRRAHRQFDAAKTALPQEAIQALAREVVRRLAFRMPRHLPGGGLPGPSEIDRLCDALISDDDDAADRLILQAKRHGVQIEALYLGYVAGAARRLGESWERDEVSFAQVTVASAKLYRIINGLRHVVASEIGPGRADWPAMFALVPGETHTLGIEMATEIFRREGWDVDMKIGLDHDTLLTQADARNYRAIVLVANSPNMLEPLTKLVWALRISHPLAHLVVAGHILDHHPSLPELAGADAVMTDIETAVGTLRAVLEGA